MKWFKHSSISSDDELISALMDRFGAEGYGVFWIICERIARFMDDSDRCSATYSLKKWSEFSRISTKKFQKLVEFLKNQNRFFLNYDENLLTIEYPNLLKYKDEYTRKCAKVKQITPDNNPTDSGESDHQKEKEKENKKENIYTPPLLTRAREENPAPDSPPELPNDFFHSLGEVEQFFIQRNGYHFHVVKKPAIIQVFTEWINQKIPKHLILQAVDYADAKNGTIPNNPSYYKGFVREAFTNYQRGDAQNAKSKNANRKPAKKIESLAQRARREREDRRASAPKSNFLLDDYPEGVTIDHNH